MAYIPANDTDGSNISNSVDTVSQTSISAMANASQSELNRINTDLSTGSIQGEQKTQMANVAEATLKAARAGRVSITQETAEKLNKIRSFDGRAEIPY